VCQPGSQRATDEPAGTDCGVQPAYGAAPQGQHVQRDDDEKDQQGPAHERLREAEYDVSRGPGDPYKGSRARGGVAQRPSRCRIAGVLCLRRHPQPPQREERAAEERGGDGERCARAGDGEYHPGEGRPQ